MPQDAEKLESELLDRITPSAEEREKVDSTVKFILQKVNERAERYDMKIEPVLVGSIAKDTWLPDPDLDIFMTFPLETPIERMESIGLEIGEGILKGEKRYAEHPYIHGTVDGLEVDLVPCYKIERPEQRLTAVDRTPLHTKYVIENMKEEQRIEVRKLKRFMKGTGVYGAEAKIEGFSGYMTELLVLKYGTFVKVMENASQWKEDHRIEIIKAEKAFNEPLKVPDPIDPRRNVASALSMDTMSKFIFACQEYMKAPKMEFFFPKPHVKLSREEVLDLMKRRGTDFLALVFEAPDVVDDILYPQLKKCRLTLKNEWTRNGFAVHDSAYEVIGSDAVVLFEFEVPSLPEVMRHTGPPVWVKDGEKFYKKWSANESALSEPFIEDGRWFVYIRRRFTRAEGLIKELIGDLNLGKDVNVSVKKQHSVLMSENIADEKYLAFLSRYFDKKPPWEN
ncbi:MAG: CCA tRNA nucleotidyltransferase [Thermoplasmata archaeon]|nr:CCA tRNA nucleotidyltransferase [Thermoplasmata archaeon]